MSPRWQDQGGARRPSRLTLLTAGAATAVLIAWAGTNQPEDTATSPDPLVDQPARVEVISPPETDCPSEDMVLVEIVADGYDLHAGDKVCVHIDELRP